MKQEWMLHWFNMMKNADTPGSSVPSPSVLPCPPQRTSWRTWTISHLSQISCFLFKNLKEQLILDEFTSCASSPSSSASFRLYPPHKFSQHYQSRQAQREPGFHVKGNILTVFMSTVTILHQTWATTFCPLFWTKSKSK